MTERKTERRESEKKTHRPGQRGSYGVDPMPRKEGRISSGEVVYGGDTHVSGHGGGRIAGKKGAPSRETLVDTVPRGEFEALRRQLEALAARVEDLEDALDAQAVKAAAEPADDLPVELVERLLTGESPVRIWREHRGLTLTALAERAEIPPGYLSEIEHRKKPGSVRAMRALAQALNVDLEDLVRDPAEPKASAE